MSGDMETLVERLKYRAGTAHLAFYTNLADHAALDREAASAIQALIAERDGLKDEIAQAWASFERTDIEGQTLSGRAMQLKVSAAQAEAQRDAALEVLRPFAAFAEHVAAVHPGWDHDGFGLGGVVGEHIAMADFRAALRVKETEHG